MNSDVVILTLIAIADLALLVYFRRRRARRKRLEQMAASLSLAIRRANQSEARPSSSRAA